jgi:non-ribosomal peptide synthetase-like protein
MLLHGPSCPELLRDETLADILRRSASDYPDHPALRWQDRTVTYRELTAAAERLAGGLRRQGCGPGQVIGLWLPRGADLLIAQAGITFSGAAWLPFDADTPEERVTTCLRSAEATGIVTTVAHAQALRAKGFQAWSYEQLAKELPGETNAPRPAPGEVAYVIYTSGSTGAPKGIAISQRSICHFLRSENHVLGVRHDDVVYQGFSAAFDMSFEEIWISYLAGATIWIAPAEVVGDPDALVREIRRQGITVLHAVPTLMGLVEGEMPSVRLINLGGEACPPNLAAKLARPGRKLFNTYGPTETTVTATLAVLRPGEEVTIGSPLPNYGAMVVDEHLRVLPKGETGQLAIFGPGLALGYHRQAELTGAKFVRIAEADGLLAYLTGDLARLRPDGLIVCLGRTDDQVKIRGFRIELGEIETKLAALPGVGTAAVLLRTDHGSERLAAFYVPSAHGTATPETLRAGLAAELPAYMVPSLFVALETMPRLSSGKIDRKSLQSFRLPEEDAARTDATDDEDLSRLFAAVSPLFPGARIRAEDDFFADLGGHSLLAARLVSNLRNDPRYGRLGVGDLYRERTLAKLGLLLRNLRTTHAPSARPKAAHRPSPWRHFLCGLAQAICLPFLVLWHMASWLGPFFTYHYNTGEPGDSYAYAIGLSLLVFVTFELLSFAVAAIGRRLLSAGIRPGRYPLWGTVFFRFWLSEKIGLLAPVRLLHGTPWLNRYLRFAGAKVGRKAFVDSLTVSLPHLLEIGDEADIGANVIIANARIEAGELLVGVVRIGQGACVETNCVLEEDTSVGDRAHLAAMSSLSAGERLPDGEAWHGAPARRELTPREALPPRPPESENPGAFMMGLYAASSLAVSCLFFLPVFPVFMLIDGLDAGIFDVFESDVGPAFAFGFFFLLAIPASGLLIALTATLAATLKRLFLRRQAVGRWPVHSFNYYRKWLVARILDASLETLHGLYASVYASTWLRMMGARIGRNTEVSTATGVTPDLLTLGDDSFVADGVTLGDEEQRGGWMSLHPTAVGARSFLGNGSYVPDGCVVPNDLLVGVQTRTPPNAAMRPGQVWLGSPAVLLPAREGDLGFDSRLTFRPSPLRRCARAFIEALRIVLPMSFVIASGYLVVHLVMPLAEDDRWLAVAGALSLAGCLYGVASFALVLALKWTLVGRYRPGAYPMWSPYVWLSEAVTCVYESLAVPNFLDFLRGTPMLPWALRSLGARLGKRVFMDTTDMTEFDCVKIGDEAELNQSSGPQTHLFEDRVMKIGDIVVGPRVSVGAASTILYGTEVGEGARLGPLTLVAKGESIPADSSWHGSPATPR